MSKRRKFKGYEKDLVYEGYNGRCAICGQPLERETMTISHGLPLSKGGTNGKDNLMLACWTCNHMKNNLSMDEFLDKISQIIEHNRKA